LRGDTWPLFDLFLVSDPLKIELTQLSHKNPWRGIRDEDRTFGLECEEVVRQIYNFFGSVCMSVSFTLSDWSYLYHVGSMDDEGDGEKVG
jgi:hypothetical protein